MSARRQRGYLYKKSNAWLLRYAETVGGKRVQRARRLASVSGEHRSKTAARELADEFLQPLNDRDGPQNAQTVKDFAEKVYLPAITQQKRASTADGYHNLWKRYLSHLEGCDRPLRQIRTVNVERILGVIATDHDLSRTTLGHIKAFLSGIFRFAKRQGALATENPVRDAVVPKARGAKETYAYSLDEISQFLELLPEPAATIVAAAAFTGARRGELRGFSWEDYDGHEIRISRAYWRDTVAEPKTVRSKAPVPVIPQLAERLNRLRASCGNPPEGLMFPAAANNSTLPGACGKQGHKGSQGPGIRERHADSSDESPERDGSIEDNHNHPAQPVDLDALARDVIIPALKAHGLKWHGWHAFRRGLATNLHHLGVQDKVIQRILRHSNVAVTQACYIKETPADVTHAMEQLSAVSG